MNILRRHQQKYPNTHTSLLVAAWHILRDPRTIFRTSSKKVWILSVVTLLAFFVPILAYANTHKPAQSPADLHGKEQKNNSATQTSLNSTTSTKHQNTGSVHQQANLSVNGQSISIPEHGTHTKVLSENGNKTSVTVTSESEQQVNGNNSSSSSSIDVQVNAHTESEGR